MLTQHSFSAATRLGEVSALLLRPPAARSLLVLAHGAGAGMHHSFMENYAGLLAEEAIATFRYQFHYMEMGRRRPDHRALLCATVRSAIAAAADLAPDLPLFAGGKSMGGRMTSESLAQEPMPGVRGVLFCAFPLHPAGKPGIDRADHLANVKVPMLFLQGTRDRLAQLELLRPVCSRLGSLATLHVVAGADHSFAVLKRSGLSQEKLLQELAQVSATWMMRQR